MPDPSQKQLWSHILRTHHKNPNIVLAEIDCFTILPKYHIRGLLSKFKNPIHLYKYDYNMEIEVTKNIDSDNNDVIIVNRFGIHIDYAYQCTYELHGAIITNYYCIDKHNLYEYKKDLTFNAIDWMYLGGNYYPFDTFRRLNYAYDAIIMGAHITFTSLLLESEVLDDDKGNILAKIPESWIRIAKENG